MRIERLKMIGFGRFAGREFDFSPALNVVFGPNEAGKTTLLSFVELMLYGAKKDGLTRRYFLDEYESYRPWGGAPYEGSLTLALDDGRRLEVFRRFDKDEFSIHDPVLGKDLSGEFRIDKRGEPLFAPELWGMTRSVFLNTVLVRQLSLSRGFEETGDLASLVTRAFSAREGRRDEGATKALALLEKALVEGVGKTERGGRSKELNDRLEALRIELEEARRHRLELLDQKERSRILEHTLAEARSKEKRLGSAIAAAELAALQVRVTRARELSGKLAESSQALKQYEQYAEFPLELREEVRRLEDRKTDCERDLGKHFERLEEIESKLEELKAEVEPLKRFLGMPQETAEEIVELRTKWQQALANVQSLRGQLSSDIARAEEKMTRYRELKALFEAIGDDSDRRLEQEADDEERINEKLLEFSSRAGRALWLKGPYKALAMGAALLSLGSAVGALVLAVLDRLEMLNAGFAWPILAALAVLSAGFAIAMRRKKAKIEAEGGDAEHDYESLMKRRKEIRSDRRTILSLAGAKDLKQLFIMRAEFQGLEQTLADNTAMMQQRRLPRLQDEVERIESRLSEILGLADLIESGRPTNDDIRRFLDNFGRAQALVEQGKLQEELRAEHLGQKNQLEQESAEIKSRLEAIYKKVGVRGYPKFQEKAEAKLKYDSLKRELERHSETLTTLLAGRSLENLAAELEEAEKTAAAGEVGGETPQPEALAGLKRELEGLRAKINEISRERNQLLGTIRTMQQKLRDPGLVEADIERAEDELRRITRRREALKLAIGAIGEAAETMHADFAPALNKAVGEFASELTSGRYGEVMIGDEFTVALRSPESASIVPVEAVSAGARDQLYFAARLALSEVLGGDRDEKVPLLLDDSFVEYDFERAGHALELLQRIARGRQVILFTCHRREVELTKLAAGDGFTLIELRDTERT